MDEYLNVDGERKLRERKRTWLCFMTRVNETTMSCKTNMKKATQYFYLFYLLCFLKPSPCVVG